MLHGRHASVTIYYAKLPNDYLSEIVNHGARYLENTVLKEPKVVLQRTKKFHMRSADERVELFILLSKLLCYLSSGRSHVGYLYDYNGNPIHYVGQPMHDTIEVQPEPPTQLLAAVTLDTPPKRKSEEDNEMEEPFLEEEIEEPFVGGDEDSGAESEATEYEGEEEMDID